MKLLKIDDHHNCKTLDLRYPFFRDYVECEMYESMKKGLTTERYLKQVLLKVKVVKSPKNWST